MQAWAVVAEEKVVRVVALMETMKKEAAEVVPNFKALAEYIDEVQEVAMDLFLKGYKFCQSRMAQLFPELNLEALAFPAIPCRDLVGFMAKAKEKPMTIVEAAPLVEV